MSQNSVLIRKIHSVISSFNRVSSILIGLMVLVVVANVVGRFLFNFPVFGTIELVELMMIVICFLAIPYTSMQRGHVRITLFIERLPRSVQKGLGRIVSILNVVVISVITYQAAVNALYYAQHLYQRTDTLEIPIAPFRAIMLLGLVILLIIEIVHIFYPLPSEKEGARGGQ